MVPDKLLNYIPPNILLQLLPILSLLSSLACFLLCFLLFDDTLQTLILFSTTIFPSTELPSFIFDSKNARFMNYLLHFCKRDVKENAKKKKMRFSKKDKNGGS